MATDVIDGLTVTFPHASPRTLTVTVGEVSATTTIEVTPVPTALSVTGGPDAAPALFAALLLLASGAAALFVSRRRPA